MGRRMAMFVVVQHSIKDQAGFAKATEEGMANLPGDVTLHQVLPNGDGSAAVCLWEAGSVDRVKQVVEGAVGRFSSNTYYEVARKGAVGLPGSSR
jgi:hypothetical protein